MKYLKSFSALNESNRFLNLKEVLNYIEDLSSDFTDDGFETKFGIMPGAIHHPKIANFDENLDDIQIKMASMGKSVIYFKLDLKNIKDQSFGGRLNNDELDLLISTITSIYKYLIHEELIISGLWSKAFNQSRGRGVTGSYRFDQFNWFTTLDELVKQVIDYNSNPNTYVEDVRIAFTGKPYKEFDGWKLEESKDFIVNGLQATESDYESLKDIIDDFNQNNFEGDDKDFEVVIHSKLFGRPVRANFGPDKLNCKAYLVMINDKNKSYSGFQISDVSELLLRLMSELGSESIMARILVIGDPMRENFTLTKDDLLNNKPMDPMSNLSFYIEIVP
jgi:hypothetical protein